MTKLEQGQVFRLLTKIQTLSQGDWLICEVIELKKAQYYRVMPSDSQIYRPIAILTFKDANDAIESGMLQLLSKKKIKKPNENKK